MFIRKTKFLDRASRLFPLLIYVGSPLKSLSASLPTSKYLPSVGDIITIKLSLAATRKQQSF